MGRQLVQTKTKHSHQPDIVFKKLQKLLLLFHEVFLVILNIWEVFATSSQSNWYVTTCGRLWVIFSVIYQLEVILPRALHMCYT